MSQIFIMVIAALTITGCSIFKSRNTDRSTQSTFSSNPAVTVEGNRVYARDAIDFETGTTTLTAASKVMLRDIASFLSTNAGGYAHLLIEAHTDRMSTLNDSMTLSHQYATAVKAELINAGVPSDKIETKGYGFTRPKSSIGLIGRDRLPTQLAEGIDRRIEFVVVK